MPKPIWAEELAVVTSAYHDDAVAIGDMGDYSVLIVGDSLLFALWPDFPPDVRILTHVELDELRTAYEILVILTKMWEDSVQ